MTDLPDDDTPLAEHPARFQAIHDALRDRLAASEYPSEQTPARTGSAP